MALEVGEKFLTVKLAGHMPVTAFPNKEKKADNQPDFKGDGIAVWIHAKKQAPPVFKQTPKNYPEL